MKRKLTVPILLLCMALIAASCSSDSDDTTTTSSGDVTGTTSPTTDTTVASTEPIVLRAAITGDEDTLNPYTYISGFPGWNLLMMQYDSLMQLDEAGEPQPWLAESVTTNADLTEYTVTIPT